MYKPFCKNPLSREQQLSVLYTEQLNEQRKHHNSLGNENISEMMLGKLAKIYFSGFCSFS